MEQFGSTVQKCVQKGHGMANSVDPDQTAPIGAV